MTARLHRLAIPATALLATLACDPWSMRVVSVHYDADTERFAVGVRLESVDAKFLGCTGAGPCDSTASEAVQGVGDAALAVLIQDLTRGGAEDLEVALVADGDDLDVHVDYTTWPGTKAADGTGVRLEREIGRRGKVRNRLVVTSTKADLQDGPHKRRLTYLPTEQGGTELQLAWLLPRRIHEVELRTAGDGADSPALLTHPELRALVGSPP